MTLPLLICITAAVEPQILFLPGGSPPPSQQGESLDQFLDQFLDPTNSSNKGIPGDNLDDDRGGLGANSRNSSNQQEVGAEKTAEGLIGELAMMGEMMGEMEAMEHDEDIRPNSGEHSSGGLPANSSHVCKDMFKQCEEQCTAMDMIVHQDTCKNIMEGVSETQCVCSMSSDGIKMPTTTRAGDHSLLDSTISSGFGESPNWAGVRGGEASRADDGMTPPLGLRHNGSSPKQPKTHRGNVVAGTVIMGVILVTAVLGVVYRRSGGLEGFGLSARHQYCSLPWSGSTAEARSYEMQDNGMSSWEDTSIEGSIISSSAPTTSMIPSADGATSI